MINIKNKKAPSAVMIFSGALVLVAGVLSVESGSSIANINIGAIEIIAGGVLAGIGIYGFIKNGK